MPALAHRRSRIKDIICHINHKCKTYSETEIIEQYLSSSQYKRRKIWEKQITRLVQIVMRIHFQQTD